MATKLCSLSLLLLLILTCTTLLVVSVRGQSPTGFISIDCGKLNSYNDSRTGLLYVTDDGYVDAGEVHQVAGEVQNMGHPMQASDVRSFPNGTRNCYTLPAKMETKYLLRASFLYGNYDGQNRIPNFHLYVGTNLWSDITMSNSSDIYEFEIMTMPQASSISVCLLNTGQGVPFISSLELRPLKDHLYPLVNSSLSLVLYGRGNYAATQKLRYPNDTFDRQWTPVIKAGTTNITTTSKVAISGKFEPPVDVMRTAVTPANGSTMEMSWKWPAHFGGQYRAIFFAMHFAELRRLPENQTRLFNVTMNDEDIGNNISPRYLSLNSKYVRKPMKLDDVSITVREAPGSTLPPIINALEVYIVRQMTSLATHSEDVDAIIKMRGLYRVKRNWMGDPCAPKSLIWDGLNCSYDDSSSQSRIISLKLGSFGWTGGIPTVLANLTQLESLDLSNNSLNGSIPEFLSKLPHLKLLDLSSNELSGKIPKALVERSTSGALKLSVANNSELCANNPNQCGKIEKKSSTKAIIIVVPIVLVVVVIVALVVIILRKANKKQPSVGGSFHLPSFHSNSKNFTYVELETITENFSKSIGKGGFGVVYHGIQENGTQVAAKLQSQPSPQGAKQFQMEAQLLTRIHHKNLVPLIGYCNDSNHVALVYEYMAGGSLQSHLSGEACKLETLSWSDRLRIAVESAQGLEYLHKGCKPAIVHRDVKTSNILLTDKLEARIADFGLSKTFQNEEVNSMLTMVMGTPGYFDPEYYTTCRLNEKSDVYSFGVVLLELITGQPAINMERNVNLVKWLETRVARGVISEIVDPSLREEYGVNVAWKILELALTCTSTMSIKRPTMTEVLMLLKECVELDAQDARRQESKSTDHNGDISVEVIAMQMSTITSPLAR